MVEIDWYTKMYEGLYDMEYDGRITHLCWRGLVTSGLEDNLLVVKAQMLVRIYLFALDYCKSRPLLIGS